MEKNPGIETYIADDDFHVRLASKPQPDGSYQWLRKDGKKWKPIDLPVTCPGRQPSRLAPGQPRGRHAVDEGRRPRGRRALRTPRLVPVHHCAGPGRSGSKTGGVSRMSVAPELRTLAMNWRRPSVKAVRRSGEEGW